jgi:hypothetical protein
MSCVFSTPDRVAPGQQHSALLPGCGGSEFVPTADETIEVALFHARRCADARDRSRLPKKPLTDDPAIVHGINRLAAIGLPVLTIVPATIGGRLGVRAVGVRQIRGTSYAAWPLWRIPLSLPSITAFLSHPEFDEGECSEVGPHLRSLGVFGVRRAVVSA